MNLREEFGAEEDEQGGGENFIGTMTHLVLKRSAISGPAQTV